MTKLFFYSITYGATFLAVFFPWIGVVAYYMFNVLHPQSIWSWIFGYFHASKLIAMGTFVGFFIKILAGRIDFASLKNSQNLYLAILWLCIVISYLFNPYGNESLRDVKLYSASTFDPATIMSNMNKALLFYFVSIFLIDDIKKLKCFTAIILFTIVYYIVWAHEMYFSGQMYIVYGARLGGPAMRGIYSDQNVFAMLFVTAIPFLFFVGDYFNNKIIRYFLWACIPLAWHVVFLTGSLGGLISLSIVMIIVAVRSERKVFYMAIPLLLLIAIVYQGGGYLLQRVDSLSGGLSDIDTAQSRFDSWLVGLKMMADHPLTGVGPGNFVKAYSDYATTQPFVAHNTFVQFASESGFFAGILYLLICAQMFFGNFKLRGGCNEDIDPFYLSLQDSIFCSISGYFVCSMFLNLATYELLYYLLILNFSLQTQLRPLINKS